jgi:hypothetical protein
VNYTDFLKIDYMSHYYNKQIEKKEHEMFGLGSIAEACQWP